MKRTTILLTTVFFLLLAVTTSTFAQTANGSASGQFSLQGMLTSMMSPKIRTGSYGGIIHQQNYLSDHGKKHTPEV